MEFAKVGAGSFLALGLEAVFGMFGILTFCGAYFLLYKRDHVIR